MQAVILFAVSFTEREIFNRYARRGRNEEVCRFGSTSRDLLYVIASPDPGKDRHSIKHFAVVVVSSIMQHCFNEGL